MPYAWSWEETGVLVRFHGVVTGEDLRRATLDFTGDRRFEGLRYAISDLSDVATLRADSAAVRQVAPIDAEASKRNPDLVHVLVVTQVLTRGMANMFHLQFDASDGKWATRSVATLEEARRWIAGKSR